jgi:hypothetical protein
MTAAFGDRATAALLDQPPKLGGERVEVGELAFDFGQMLPGNAANLGQSHRRLSRQTCGQQMPFQLKPLSPVSIRITGSVN